MKAEVGRLREQRREDRDRVALRGRHEVVVVDEDEPFRALPPRPAAKLVGRDIGSGDAALEELRELAHPALGHLVRGEVRAEVLLRDLAQQGTTVVDDEDLGLGRPVQARDLVHDAAEHGRLAGVRVAVQVQQRFGDRIDRERGEVRLVDAEQQFAGLRAVRRLRGRHGAQVGMADARGQQPQLGPCRSVPRRRDPGHEVVDPVGEARRVVHPVDAGQRREHLQAAVVEAAAGDGRDVLRRLAVDLGVGRVAQAQLDAGADEVLDVRPDLHPTRRGDDHVHAVGEAARGDRLDLRLQHLELGAQRAPAVDDEEDVAVAVVGETLRTALAVRVDGVDAVLPEVHLAGVQQAGDLGHRAADHVRLGAGRDAADVREVLQAGEAAAAEVDDEELHLLRRVGESQGGHRRPRERALAAQRSSDDRHVAGRAAERDREVLAALLQRHVDDAERDRERPRTPPARGDETERRVLDEVAEELVEGGRRHQRRQPHLVGRGATSLHGLDRDLEGVALLLRFGVDHDLRLVHRRLRPPHRRGGEQLDRRRAGALSGAAGRRPPPPTRRRSGHVRGAELRHRLGVGLQDAGARLRGQVIGVRHAEDRAGLGRRERPQTDAVREVRVEAAQLALLQPLGGQQQVHLQRASEPADVDERVDELRLRRQELGELVGNDEQGGQWRQVGAASATRLLVVGHVGERTGGPQQLLSAHHLALERVLHAVDEGDLLTEVRDDRRDVRHVGHAGERRPTLEVDEHEVELLRRMGHREGQHERAEHLGLPGAGGTDDETVRAHTLLRRFLDVEDERAAVLGLTDRHAEPVALQSR